MKKLIAILALVFISGTIYAQTGNRNFELNGNFSICPPRGWTVREIPGLSYKIFYGKSIYDFIPNICFADEYYEGSLSEYLSLNNKNMNILFPNMMEIIKTENFQTNNSINGLKQVTINLNSGRMLKQVYYFFSNGASKIVITCSVPTGISQDYEALFDESIKTFEFIKR
jgi:hypothetical protein